MSYSDIVDRLTLALAKLRFSLPITHIYNPLVYAREPHMRYFDKYAHGGVPTVLLGMNPGPWGMAQTGVPFGDVTIVRDWLGITGKVARPNKEHPARQIEGFACKRSEVSGTRLWGLAQEEFATPERFFKHFFVINYCPLVFMDASGKNFTPDKMRTTEAEPLYAACDQALRETIVLLKAQTVVGVGAFAETRARKALASVAGLDFGRILHPSPASPLANKDWPGAAKTALKALRVWP